jgi:PAS domain S-box-containing protein
MLGRSFRNTSIRNKFRILVLAISAFAVTGSCAVFIAFLWFSTRTQLVQRQETMAAIVGDQSTAALEFDQPAQAATILGTLKAERQVVVAAIYTRQGKLFASYVREGRRPDAVPARPAPDGQRFEEGDLLDFHPIYSGGERVGVLHVRSDLEDLRNRVYVVTGTAVLVLLGASILVYFLSTKLGVLVTGPVLRLAEVAEAVSKTKDYSVRVESGGQDEMGHLIGGFNEMLSQIQARDGALASARDDLEKRVQERTRELQVEVTERKAAEQSLHEKDARLTEAQEIARLGSWEWNVSTNKVVWSDEVYRISGIMPSKFGGDLGDFLAISHPDDRALLREALESACRKREPLTTDFRIIRPDGSVRSLHARGKVILDDSGRPVRLAATLQDITERKQADQAILDLNRELQARMTELAAANQELEGFSYSVSHDLRAPLRAIDGYSRMLIEDFGDQAVGESRRYLDVIVQNTRRMGQLIDDLLSFSRMGRKSLETSSLDMNSLMKSVIEDLRQQHPDRPLDIRVEDLPRTKGDLAMFRQVCANLISNAIKYTRGREPTVIEIGARVDEKEVSYYVKDNGVGFEMEFAHKLFGVFQRLHSSKEFEGTGVGLALVQRIVQRHGGRVWAEGKVGEGATFYFALPRDRRVNGDV